MTYDIMLVRVRPGLTLQETLDRLNADFDPMSTCHRSDLLRRNGTSGTES
ncbi:hypothetical protein ABZ960_14515 [Streptomyces pseudovenezuelae]